MFDFAGGRFPTGDAIATPSMLDSMQQTRFDFPSHGGSRQERHARTDLDRPLDVLHVIEDVD